MLPDRGERGGASTVEPLATGIAFGLFERVAQDKIPLTTFGYGRGDSADGRVFEWVFPLGTTYWDQAAAMIAYPAHGASCAGTQAPVFTSCLPPPPAGLVLAGFAVTTHHYLAAGYIADDEQGLLLFDLQAGGTPMRLLWPPPFAPFDLADTPDGGLLILDRSNATYFQRHVATRPDLI